MRQLGLDLGDVDRFETICDALLGEFEPWLAAHRPELDTRAHVEAVRQALQLKFSHLDSHLGRWREPDVLELLLGLYPRKVLATADDVAETVPALQAFVRFLDERGLLTADSSPAPELEDLLGEIDDDFAAAMGEPELGGPAKLIALAMQNEGVDLEDPDAVEAWLEDFNARPDEEREGVLGPPPVEDPWSELTFPPVSLDEAALAEAAAATTMVQRLRAFVDYVGDGLELTQTGNLKLADGKALVEALGTDDEFDPLIGDRQFRTSTTEELRGVDTVYRLALDAGFVRKAKGRLLPVKKRRGMLADDPYETWWRAARALVDQGVVGGLLLGGAFWTHWLDDSVFELLIMLYAVGEAAPVEALQEMAWEGVQEAFPGIGEQPEHMHPVYEAGIHSHVDWLVERLAFAGLVEHEGERVEERARRIRLRGGSVRITLLGIAFVRPLVLARGYDAPLVGELSGEPAAEVLAAVAERPLDVAEAELQAWVAARDPVAAAQELGAALRQADASDDRVMAWPALDALDDTAEPVIRDLLAEPVLRPYAALWLNERGCELPPAVTLDDLATVLVDVLATTLATEGPEEVAATLLQAAPEGEDPVGMVEELWRVDSPHTDAVLEALGGSGDKQLAKAARKSLFKRRSV